MFKSDELINKTNNSIKKIKKSQLLQNGARKGAALKGLACRDTHPLTTMQIYSYSKCIVRNWKFDDYCNIPELKDCRRGIKHMTIELQNTLSYWSTNS